MPDSSDPVWAEEEQQQRQQQQMPGSSTPPATNGLQAVNSSEGLENGHGTPQPSSAVAAAAAGAVEGAQVGPESMPLPADVVWGPLVSGMCCLARETISLAECLPLLGGC